MVLPILLGRFTQETFALCHVVLVMSYLVVTLEPVRVMEAGVVLKAHAGEVEYIMQLYGGSACKVTCRVL